MGIPIIHHSIGHNQFTQHRSSTPYSFNWLPFSKKMQQPQMPLPSSQITQIQMSSPQPQLKAKHLHRLPQALLFPADTSVHRPCFTNFFGPTGRHSSREPVQFTRLTSSTSSIHALDAFCPSPSESPSEELHDLHRIAHRLLVRTFPSICTPCSNACPLPFSIASRYLPVSPRQIYRRPHTAYGMCGRVSH